MSSDDLSAVASAESTHAAPPSQRVLAAVFDLFVMSSFALAASIATFMAYMSITGNDFDGPLEYNTLFDWFALGMLSSFALLYSSLEIVFLAAFGKRTLGMCIGARYGPSLSPGRRVSRWLVKYSPLIALCVLSWTSYQVLRQNLPWGSPLFTSWGFDELNDVLSSSTWALVGIALCVNSIWFAARRQMLYDYIAHSRVVQSTHPEKRARGPRGFDPILKSRVA